MGVVLVVLGGVIMLYVVHVPRLTATLLLTFTWLPSELFVYVCCLCVVFSVVLLGLGPMSKTSPLLHPPLGLLTKGGF